MISNCREGGNAIHINLDDMDSIFETIGQIAESRANQDLAEIVKTLRSAFGAVAPSDTDEPIREAEEDSYEEDDGEDEDAHENGDEEDHEEDEYEVRVISDNLTTDVFVAALTRSDSRMVTA